MKSEIQEKLHQLALKRSTPFCYSCYNSAPSGCCKICGSDDLMRLVDGVGCEYGTHWIIQHILTEEITSVRFHPKAPPNFIKVYHRSDSDVMFN